MRRWASEIGRFLRLGLPAAAVYALVLQAFLVGAAPAAAFDPSGAPLCSELVAGPDQPAPAQPAGHVHDGACVIHCGAQSPAGLLGHGEDAAPFVRDALLAAPEPLADADGQPRTHDRVHGARGPPRD